MLQPKQRYYTSEDYWNLPEGERAELIDGRLYAMAPPSRIHQKLVMELSALFHQYVKSQGGDCQVYPAPFAVNLDADDKNWVEPDISVICDKSKLTDRGCKGAPDFIAEIVSPGSRKIDYSTKNTLYSDAGVREYWIVDPAKERTTVYRYEEDAAPTIFPFASDIQVGIYQSLSINIGDLLSEE
ncbi:Uma2 family endonuclease [Lacrimispora sp. 210928-DFI.3.58]|uniref:Uma2 family endonuclease n=1 Tax=Lacrimispora sp. 210928-DFI.3.58 TaxID=2883214 RepID=UPI0015B6A0B1|nr:Uma2 family endonuclease [Lacrimispora sp. 210928-DFI.3.58]MCB7317558.1 Uma2 family endonuclease [Lacrimispora sp. 210928-DFI.3.58]